MPSAVDRPAVGRRQRLVLRGVSWREYSRLLGTFDRRPQWKLTYDRGRLEIMAPSYEHEDDCRVLHGFVCAAAEEYGLPLKFGGATTLRKRPTERGAEADECYWIRSAPAMAGVRRVDLTIHPPPDLVIEADVSRSSRRKLAVFAALGVPEVWQIAPDSLSFLVIRPGGTFEHSATSAAFPFLRSADVFPHLVAARAGADDLAAVRAFRQWVRGAKDPG